MQQWMEVQKKLCYTAEATSAGSRGVPVAPHSLMPAAPVHESPSTHPLALYLLRQTIHHCRVATGSGVG